MAVVSYKICEIFKEVRRATGDSLQNVHLKSFIASAFAVYKQKNTLSVILKQFPERIEINC